MTAEAPPSPPAALSELFRPVRWSELPAWSADRHDLALAAFARSAAQGLVRPYRSGSLGVDSAALAGPFARALELAGGNGEPARQFFEREFIPCRVMAPAGGSGFVTGFYEPEAEASPVRTARHSVPLYRRPPDLVDIDDVSRPAAMDPYFAFARQTKAGLVPYFDRAAIEAGALDGAGLELAWLTDSVDAFFIHVQGAARLRMTTGEIKRVTYAAKTGHPFTGPGKVLADLGELVPAEITMQSIRRWLADHPARIDEILHRNRSYIFFREAPVDDPALGPLAAAKVPLTAGRSMAVDRLLHTFATPFYIDAPGVTAFDGKPFRRLMIAQDTGSAIVGPARGDLFAGSGDTAGEIAGVIRAAADFYALLPKPLLAGFSA